MTDGKDHQKLLDNFALLVGGGIGGRKSTYEVPRCRICQDLHQALVNSGGELDWGVGGVQDEAHGIGHELNLCCWLTGYCGLWSIRYWVRVEVGVGWR